MKNNNPRHKLVSILLDRAIQESLSPPQVDAYLTGLQPILTEAEHAYMSLVLKATNINPELMACELHDRKIAVASERLQREHYT